MKCKYCDGKGWTAEHDPNDPHWGGVCENCPIQVQCETCKGTGIVEGVKMKDVCKKYFSEEKDSEKYVVLQHSGENLVGDSISVNFKNAVKVKKKCEKSYPYSYYYIYKKVSREEIEKGVEG